MAIPQDEDNSGTITHNELKILFKSLEIEATDEEIQSLIQVVDVDQSGSLSFEEFVTMICLMAANEDKQKEQDHANLRAVFDSVGMISYFYCSRCAGYLLTLFPVDSDKSGSISTDELGQMFQTLGYEATAEEIAELIQMVDTDGNGVLDFDEFVALMDIFLQHEQATN